MSEYLPCILCVKDLSICCVEEHLRVEFSPFGTISKVEIKKGTETFKSLGYGFVSFTNHRDAEHAMVSLQGRMMFGRSMKISWGDREFIHKNPPSIIKEQHAEISFSFKSDQLDCMVYERTISQLFSLFGCEVVDAAFKVHSISKKFQVQNGSGFVHFELSPHGVKCAIDAVCALQNSVVNERIIIDCDLSNSLRELMGIELSPTRTRSNSYVHKSKTPPKLLASQKMSARHVTSQDGDGTVGSSTIPHSISMDSFATDSSTSDTAPTRASSPLTVSLRDTVTSLLNSKNSSAYSRVFQPRVPELDKSEARRFTSQSELHYLTMVHFEHLTGPSTPPHHLREKYSVKRESQEGLYGADHPTTRYSPGLPPPFPAWSPYQQHNQQQLLQLQQQQAVVDWHNAQSGQYPGPQTVTYAPQQVSGMVQHQQYLPQHYQMQTFQPLHPVPMSTPDPSYWHPTGIVHHQTAHLHHQTAAAHPAVQMASSNMDGSQTSATVAAQGGHPGQHPVMWLGPPPMPPTYSVIHSAPYMPYPQLPPQQQHGGGYFNGYVQQYGTPMISFPQTPQLSTGYNPTHPSGRRDRQGFSSNNRPYSTDNGGAVAGLQAPTNSPLLETEECRERDDYSRTMSDLSTDAPHTGCSGPESQVDRALTPSIISPQGPLAQEEQHEQPAVYSAQAALPTIVEESYTYAVGGSRRPSVSSDSGVSADRIATALKGEIKSAECLATMDPALNATTTTAISVAVDATSASMTPKVDTSVVGGGSSVNGDEVTMTDSSALSSAELSSALLHLQLFNAANLSTN